MIVAEASWSAVHVGAYIRDRNGKTWRVEDERADQILLQDAEGRQVAMTRPAPQMSVTMLAPSEAEALDLVTTELGAEVVLVKEPGKPAVCPPLRRQIADVHTHMFLLHGVYTKTGPGSRSIERLLEHHREDHMNPDLRSHAWVTHEHH